MIIYSFLGAIFLLPALFKLGDRWGKAPANGRTKISEKVSETDRTTA